MKVVIVGGVAGGATCATRLRRLSEETKIVLFERSGYVSFANCGLPYYLGQVITDKRALTVQTKQGLEQRYHFDIRIHTEVIKIEEEQKLVVAKNLLTGEVYEEAYDKLVLATGATPIRPSFIKPNMKRVFTLRNVEDTYQIDNYLREHKAKRACVIGGGFIGLEMAENLVKRGIEVMLIEKGNQVMGPLDMDMAAILPSYLIQNGVSVALEKDITSIDEHGEDVQINFQDGDVFSCDLVVAAIGVLPDSKILEETSIKRGIKGSVSVNSFLQTSNPDIYAIGDLIEINHFVSKNKTLISLAGIANKQGRIAANNITLGNHETFVGGLGTSIMKLFSLTVASVGLNEKQLKALNIAYDYTVVTGANHATYYPGATSMRIKVLFSKEDYRILGAQIIGGNGVDKRIDVLATAMMGGLSADCLKELDLAYAPPFGSAKDSINMVGFIVDNLKNNLLKQAYYSDLVEVDSNIGLLDVRTKMEYANGRIKGFRNIPLDELREKLGQLDKKKRYYVMCQSGMRSWVACSILRNNGFDCLNVVGGYGYLSTILQEKERVQLAKKQKLSTLFTTTK